MTSSRTISQYPLICATCIVVFPLHSWHQQLRHLRMLVRNRKVERRVPGLRLRVDVRARVQQYVHRCDPRPGRRLVYPKLSR